MPCSEFALSCNVNASAGVVAADSRPGSSQKFIGVWSFQINKVIFLESFLYFCKKYTCHFRRSKLGFIDYTAGKPWPMDLSLGCKY